MAGELDGMYIDPRTGLPYNAGGGEGVPGSVIGGRWGLSYALGDPASGTSEMYYYGGDRDFSEREATRLAQEASTLGNRAGVTANFDPANQVGGMQGRYAGDLERAMNGDPRTATQRQLQTNTAAGQAMLASRAASGTGGLAQAAAIDAAGQGVGQLGAQGAADAYGLMQKERMDAMGAYDANAAAMRGAGLAQAMGQAGLDIRQRAMNDAARAQAEKQQFRSIQSGMQGEIGRRRALASATGTAMGTGDAAARAAQESSAREMNTILGGIGGAAEATGRLASRYQQPKPAGSK